DDAKPLNPKLLHFLTQAPVLGAHVLPVEIGRPETKGGAARLREPGLDGGGDDREDVAGHLAVPAHLEREEQQASRHQGAEQYDLPNLHLPTPREKARTKLSHDGQLALNLAEMQAIQAHFGTLGRDPTDVELETLAQTSSAHCW